ncbi:MAG TPA: isocitrate lyase/phosphoenolpyruvate mutase family protein [Candidatus Limnocylindrales bacterium]|nr:isocitrate lyase/phosphoenolpyruvate mutase family protein [Candidatus Limnocylindrales bacterium]
MTGSTAQRAEVFRGLHRPGDPLRLANAWDAGSARLIEGCGAAALATTSAGLAWANGYPDGDLLPTAILVRAVEAIVRVTVVPLSVDAEGGYSDDPAAVGQTVGALIDAGAVGINIEDGSGSPDLLCDKISAARTAAAAAGVPLFVNARTDVYLRRLVDPGRAVDETLARAERYRAAGADGLFVPAVVAPDAIRAIVAGTDLPLNVLVYPGLPPVAELAALGVARVSAGSGIAQAALGLARDAATQFLAEGRYDAIAGRTMQFTELNAIFG